MYSFLCCFCFLSYFYVYTITFESNVTCNAKFIVSRYFFKNACIERVCICGYFDLFDCIFKRLLCLFINVAYIYGFLCCFCFLSYFYVYGVTFESNITCNAKLIASRYFFKKACIERCCICCYFDCFNCIFKRLLCLFVNVAYIDSFCFCFNYFTYLNINRIICTVNVSSFYQFISFWYLLKKA